MATNQYGTIFVQLNKGLIASGEQVNGVIMLYLNQPFPGNAVTITIRGTESTKLVKTIHHRPSQPGQPAPPPTYEDRAQESILCNQTVDVFTAPGGMVGPGQFAFPFSFATGENWPSSFNWEWNEHGRNCFGRIQYLVIASIRPTSGQVSPTHSAPIVLNDTLPAGSIKGAMQDTKQQVTHCCCFSKGECLLRTHFEKSQYAVGEEAVFFTEVDNSKCQSDITNVLATFNHSLTIRAQDASKHITNTLQRFDLGRIPAGETRMGPQAIMNRVPIRDNQGSNLPATANTGKLINNSYSISSIMDMDATQCCQNAPTGTLSIQVVSPQVAPQQWAEMPPGWNPQQMPAVTVQVNITPGYGPAPGGYGPTPGGYQPAPMMPPGGQRY